MNNYSTKNIYIYTGFKKVAKFGPDHLPGSSTLYFHSTPGISISMLSVSNVVVASGGTPGI